jgi:hypothetical protein
MKFGKHETKRVGCSLRVGSASASCTAHPSSAACGVFVTALASGTPPSTPAIKSISISVSHLSVLFFSLAALHRHDILKAQNPHVAARLVKAATHDGSSQLQRAHRDGHGRRHRERRHGADEKHCFPGEEPAKTQQTRYQ